MTIVQDSAELDGGELIAQGTDVPVKGETLEVNMSSPQDGGARGLVASTGLDTNEPVLDDIDAADTVLPAERVQGVEDVNGVGVLLAVGGDLDGETSLELNGDALGYGRRVFGSGGQLPHISGGSDVGVLENTGFVGDVEQVLVSRPRLRGGLGDGNAALFGVREESLASGEAVVEFLKSMSILRVYRRMD